MLNYQRVHPSSSFLNLFWRSFRGQVWRVGHGMSQRDVGLGNAGNVANPFEVCAGVLMHCWSVAPQGSIGSDASGMPFGHCWAQEALWFALPQHLRCQMTGLMVLDRCACWKDPETAKMCSCGSEFNKRKRLRLTVVAAMLQCSIYPDHRVSLIRAEYWDDLRGRRIPGTSLHLQDTFESVVQGACKAGEE